MQGYCALCIGVHSERIIARKLALCSIGANTRPVFGHDFLDLKRAVAWRIGDGVDITGFGGLDNGHRSAVVRSSVFIDIYIDIVIIDLSFDYAILSCYVHTIRGYRNLVWHLERETVERPLPIVFLVQHQGLTHSIHPSVSAICLLHFLANRVGPLAIANLLL